MSRPGRDDSPDRLYTLTGGRSRPDSDAFDLVTLVVSECDPTPGMQSEHAAILRMCTAPTAVVEIAAELRIPVGIATILLSDLLHAGRITVRHPHTGTATPGSPWTAVPDATTLEKVLVGLRKL
ncbi:Protein of uncharacterised function (DUF742) [Nocardia otitidiscaviarum]|uniref:DUF742 domain-containing protein n=1 Tax=Nocardia otitidiscaviarum TaxID=1823 RepID=A0A378YTZ1_9NOCA|nr:DUF742 domain-containing protein [Nocardia otitidiscaviarum]MBF6489143.1 DUF742 domain-containing protein [Nocardia otitidiscaviarum]MCP9624167.1 DUF742 domain-containing protein [Nocardia otitidiscaviarum]QDP80599.1 DUF742 domain-containing protein [Nocardia otitidiscaviarum]SUA79879.1 Protein of uncharacterised function (DUF742) [Nocardia otitidiscaviarum]